ncbi:hypothetical protein CDD83_9954 [Cordyceps sp. RAO-2017]|nr:hypothetical protein CDD83_9954 [Cordyceps sp. RAO-2017]
MPLSLKDKGSRLQAFVRKDPDAAVGTNASAPQAEAAADRRPDSPQRPIPAPTRQELAEAARLNLSAAPRNSAAARQQQDGRIAAHARLASPPPRATQPSPTPRRARESPENQHNDIFCGSQLGESFMNSGPSTPRNEADGSEGEATPNAKRHHAHARNAGREAPAASAAFRIEDNLMMSIVPTPGRRILPQMMDGFHDDATVVKRRHPQNYKTQLDRPSSTALLRPELPLREVRVKRLPLSSRYAAYETREPSSPSPSVESARWQGQRELEDVRPLVAAPETGEEPDSVSEHDRPARVSEPARAGGGARRPARESPMPPIVAVPKLPRDRKRRRGSPDYDDNILSSMTYSDLQDEPFDLDPARASGQNGQDMSAKLPLKLEQYRQQGEREQQHFFAAMSMEDWEASGDWFVEQFADLMKRLRDARRSKRRMIQSFEDEAARREEAVRMRSETIDRKLARMRQDGQRVVEDRGL